MIQVFKPSLSISDKVSVLKSILKNEISGSSPMVSGFESLASNKFNREHSIAVSNGSVALDLSFQLLDLNEGDEVILPTFTIVSCLAAVIRAGGKPVFCDVDSNSWNMKLEHIEKLVTKNTRAVLMVHLYGLVAEADKISKFCKDNKLKLIEDASEAHGQKINNQNCGSFGDISTFSFYANKHVTTGEGGMVLTDDSVFAHKLKQMRNLDFNSENRFQHDNLYWNYRLSGIQAALGISQIKTLEKRINKKIQQGANYNKLFSGYEDILQIPVHNDGEVINHYWVYGLVLRNGVERGPLLDYLQKEGIQTRPFFWPLHLQNALPKNFYVPELDLKNSELLGKSGFYIPLGDHVTYKNQKFISDKIINFLST
jgi:perosamine synthetase|tara:strand:+ start:1428 stop:2537 length:1110 start_codon:yes stop_codon:yes gene_type:complete